MVFCTVKIFFQQHDATLVFKIMQSFFWDTRYNQDQTFGGTKVSYCLLNHHEKYKNILQFQIRSVLAEKADKEIPKSLRTEFSKKFSVIFLHQM